MIHRSLLLLAFAFLPLFTFSQERIEVNDPEIKFSYLLPEGWEVKDDGYDYEIHHPEIKDAYISFTYLEDGQGSGNLESLGTKPSFEDDFDYEIKYVLSEDYPNLSVDEMGKMTIDGSPALWARFQSNSNDDTKTGIFFMYQKLNQTFKIAGTAPSEHFEQIQPYFTSIIESFNSTEL